MALLNKNDRNGLRKEKSAAYGIERASAVAIVGDGDHDTGIRDYGVPAGYEFMSLVEGILLASSGENRLTDEAKALVSAVDAPSPSKYS